MHLVNITKILSTIQSHVNDQKWNKQLAQNIIHIWKYINLIQKSITISTINNKSYSSELSGRLA